MNDYYMEMLSKSNENTQIAKNNVHSPMQAYSAMGNCALLQCMKKNVGQNENERFPRLLPVIQRASVGVSLMPDCSNEFTSSQIRVNTINFGGRFDTGLKVEKLKERRYTPAQVLVSEAVKVKIPQLLKCEEDLRRPLNASEVRGSLGKIGPVAMEQVWPALPEHWRPFYREPEHIGVFSRNEDTQGDHTIADSFIKKYQKDRVKEQPLDVAMDFYHNMGIEILKDNEIAGEPEGRILESNTLIKNSLTLINGSIGAKLGFFQWNVIMKEIIKKYNMGYAKSLLATQGRGTGGDGEGYGMDNLRRIKHSTGDEVQPYLNGTALINLLDMDSTVAFSGVQRDDYETIAGIPAESAKPYIESAHGQLLSPEITAPLSSTGIKKRQQYMGMVEQIQNIPLVKRFLAMSGWYVEKGQSEDKNTRREKKAEVLNWSDSFPFKLWETIAAFTPVQDKIQHIMGIMDKITSSNEAGLAEAMSFLTSDVIDIKSKVIELSANIKQIPIAQELNGHLADIISCLPWIEYLSTELSSIYSEVSQINTEKENLENVAEEEEDVSPEQLEAMRSEFGSQKIERFHCIGELIAQGKEDFSKLNQMIEELNQYNTLMAKSI